METQDVLAHLAQAFERLAEGECPAMRGLTFCVRGAGHKGAHCDVEQTEIGSEDEHYWSGPVLPDLTV